MTWCLRDCVNENAEGPQYTSKSANSSPLCVYFGLKHVFSLLYLMCISVLSLKIGGSDLFTIKLHGGGHFDAASGSYVGGGFRYVDKCDGDEISILELENMLEEAFGCVGYTEISYKLPNVEGPSTKLEKDTDVLDMCSKLGLNRLVYMYAVTLHLEQTPQTEEFRHSQMHYDFFDAMNPFERQEIEIFLLMDDITIARDAEVANEIEDENKEKEVETQVVSDVEVGSFHDDSSNVDSEDDEVCAVRDKRKTVKENREGNVPRIDVLNDEVISDISDNDYNSEDERMAANSTDEDCVSYAVFNERTDMEDPKFKLGMMFSSANSFRAAVQKHAITQRKAVAQVRNFGKRVKYVCKVKGCKWMIYASVMQDSKTYQIKTYLSKHTCPATFKQKYMTSNWIAEFYENEIRMNPTWPLAAFHKKIVNDWGCEVSIYAVGRAKRKALEVIKGSHVAQYAKLWDYVHAVRKAMPDSTIDILLDEPEAGCDGRRFKRIYVCLGPLKKGFTKGCRPIIGLDGCHLKGPYGGQLLTAVGCDSNDGMYPIAWAVVEAENSETWNWFLNLLALDVNIINSGSWTFISDRQKVNDHYPPCTFHNKFSSVLKLIMFLNFSGINQCTHNSCTNAEHRFCVMHLYRNMYKDHKGVGSRALLWLAARSTTEYMFKKHMAELQKVKHMACNYLHYVLNMLLIIYILY